MQRRCGIGHGGGVVSCNFVVRNLNDWHGPPRRRFSIFSSFSAFKGNGVSVVVAGHHQQSHIAADDSAAKPYATDVRITPPKIDSHTRHISGHEFRSWLLRRNLTFRDRQIPDERQRSLALDRVDCMEPSQQKGPLLGLGASECVRDRGVIQRVEKVHVHFLEI